MKYVKMLGFAAVAATVLMTFLGADSVSATVLCKTTTTPCAEKYAVGTGFDASMDPGTSALWTKTSGAEAMTCTESTMKGEIESSGGASETTKIKVTETTFGQASCSSTVDVLLGQGTLEIHSIANTDSGTVTASGFEVTTGEFGVSCVYGAGANTDLGVLTGGSMGTIDVEAVIPKVGGSFLCPADEIWRAKFTVTEPSGAVYVEPE